MKVARQFTGGNFASMRSVPLWTDEGVVRKIAAARSSFSVVPTALSFRAETPATEVAGYFQAVSPRPVTPPQVTTWELIR